MSLELGDKDIFALSCGVLRYIRTVLILERHYSKDLPESSKVSPRLLDEATHRIERVIAVLETAIAVFYRKYQQRMHIFILSVFFFFFSFSV